MARVLVTLAADTAKATESTSECASGQARNTHCVSQAKDKYAMSSIILKVRTRWTSGILVDGYIGLAADQAPMERNFHRRDSHGTETDIGNRVDV